MTLDEICKKSITITEYKEFRSSMYGWWSFKISGVTEDDNIDFGIISEDRQLAESILRTLGISFDPKRANSGILSARNLLEKPLRGKIVRRKARAYTYYEFCPARR
jgi:hypothetical protein